MKRKFDIVFISNQPSFYKVRQWNALSKHRKIFAVFTDAKENDRNYDFVSEKPDFDYIILQSRGQFSKFLEALEVVRNIEYKRLIIGGWESLTALLLPFFTPKRKNCVFVESSVYEYKPNTLKDTIKKMYFRRISIAFPSGPSQKALIDKFHFKGASHYTGGCGILNYCVQPPYQERLTVRKFLYVGRLVEVKNLELLIEVFNEMPSLSLDIVGFGELESKLKSLSNDNINFVGAVNNKDLSSYYRNADVFVLPSKVEPWGLVVEEALNNGTPVVVSDKVGCHSDLVTEQNGLVFKYDDKESLRLTIEKVCDIEFYNKLRRGVSLMDFNKRAQHQVDVFL